MFIQTKSHHTYSLRITKPKIGHFHFHSVETSLTSGINYKEYLLHMWDVYLSGKQWPMAQRESKTHFSRDTTWALTLYGVFKFFNSRLLNDWKLNEVCRPATSRSCFHKANLQRPWNIVSVKTIMSDINYSQHMSSLRELCCRRSLLPGS